MTIKRTKRGIALIIVLGMLALLVMVGVAFSIFMRTERAAAGSFQHDVRARQLLYAAAARAIQTIDEKMIGKTYPSENYWVSQGANPFTISTNQIWAQHIPNSLLSQIDGATASWISVPNGRIGFLILNASGLLDANASGGDNVARGMGVSPDEIQLTELAEINDIEKFIDHRKYESVAHMKAAGMDAGLTESAHFVPFSLLSTNLPIQPVDISGDEDALIAKKADIIAKWALKTGGVAVFPVVNTDMAFDSLLDYVDKDSIPRNLNSPTTERVPMINEVRIKPIITPAQSLLFQATVELMYPFVSLPSPRPNYDIEYSISITLANVGTTPSGFPTPPSPLTGVVPTSWKGDLFLDVPLPIALPSQVPVPSATWGGTTACFRVVCNYLRVVERTSRAIVDSVVPNLMVTPVPPPFSAPPAPNITFYPRITVPVLPKLVNGSPGGSECLDPRYNYSSAFWLMYQAGINFGDPVALTNGTPASTNAYTSYWFKNPAVANDMHIWMHVADQPLQTPAELSYIVRGGNLIPSTAWRTFRLLEDKSPADPIYDHFVVPPTNGVSRGLVNPNTDSVPVLAAVFKDMLLDRYPGDMADKAICIISSAEARQLANAWTNDPTWNFAFSSKQGMVGNTAYKTAVENLVNAILPQLKDSLLAPAKEFRVEGAFRNMMGLMDPLQNYFYIVLFAQSSTKVQLPRAGDTPGVFVDTVRSDQIGLLELWRDPFMRTAADGSTHHPMLIRRFEILSQE